MTRADGVYFDVDHDEYHDDSALSSSGVKLLTKPSCPAKFRYAMDHPESRKPTEAMDRGQAYHTLVFGAGPEIVVVDADSWRTTAARQQRDEARDAGKVPLLPDDMAAVLDMVDVLKAYKFEVGDKMLPLFPSIIGEGHPEVSFWWHDLYQVECRGRVDWLPLRNGQRLIVPDLKSARSAEPSEFGRAAMDLHYAQQADWYLRGLRAVGEADETSAFLFIAQEPTPPYVPQIIQLNTESMRAGEVLNDRALETYARCLETNTWPGYEPGIALASLPGWFLNKIESEQSDV